ncbi:BLUF domain-containing protein [Brevundimonas fluminis]|jgi:hypothetical protein|uniref:BLUF domain-containing protein n=1 Tax=Brevundimonas fluminis TaxID=2487274 RepID=UPI000F658840|nr:BLUF domain-containing protein [Brevundimonas fluminis]
MPELCQVAYVSRATAPMDHLLTIAEILAVSQRNNWRDGITGALVYADGRFFQTVEGRPESIERLLGRVGADPRHADLEVVLRRQVAERGFSDWSMAVPRVTPEAEPLMRDAVETATRDPATAIELLRRLAEVDAIHT